MISSIFGFILLCIFIVLVFGASIIGRIISLIFGSSKNQNSGRQYSNQNTNRQNQKSTAKNKSPKDKKKIFEKDEGEYIDFEEVKEDRNKSE